MVFPVVMYGCDRWTIKKAEHQRIDAFELWCRRRLLRVPLDCKDIQLVHPEGNQSWVFIGRSDVDWKIWCWSWSSNTLATWFEELTHLKTPWCWERLKVGGEGDNRGWDGWMASLPQWRWVWVNSGSWWWTGRPGVLWPRVSRRVRHDWATELNCLTPTSLHIWSQPGWSCHKHARYLGGPLKPGLSKELEVPWPLPRKQLSWRNTSKRVTSVTCDSWN